MIEKLSTATSFTGLTVFARYCLQFCNFHQLFILLDFHTYKTIKTTKWKPIKLPKTSTHLSLKNNGKSANCALTSREKEKLREKVKICTHKKKGKRNPKIFERIYENLTFE